MRRFEAKEDERRCVDSVWKERRGLGEVLECWEAVGWCTAVCVACLAFPTGVPQPCEARWGFRASLW